MYRLNNIASSLNVWKLPENKFRELVKDIFGIEDGLDVSARRYVETLRELGGRASLDTLATMLHIDKSTIQYFVEPVLLYKRLIKITPKGRILV